MWWTIIVVSLLEMAGVQLGLQLPLLHHQCQYIAGLFYSFIKSPVKCLQNAMNGMMDRCIRFRNNITNDFFLFEVNISYIQIVIKYLNKHILFMNI